MNPDTNQATRQRGHGELSSAEWVAAVLLAVLACGSGVQICDSVMEFIKLLNGPGPIVPRPGVDVQNGQMFDLGNLAFNRTPYQGRVVGPLMESPRDFRQ